MSKALIDSMKRALRETPKAKGHRVQPVREALDEDPIYRKTDSIRHVATKGGMKLNLRRLDN